jgi:hypothetical protein
MKKTMIIGLVWLVVSVFALTGCDATIPEEEGPRVANQSDFIGRWETDSGSVSADIAQNKFEFVNKTRIPNIVFEMNVTSWENVPCEVIFYKEVNGRDVPDYDFSNDWRKGKTTYKIIGTVTKNNSPYNDLANIGSTQSIYFHHSGYSAIFIGVTRTDATSGYFSKK